jgi:hypothetical protein
VQICGQVLIGCSQVWERFLEGPDLSAPAVPRAR